MKSIIFIIAVMLSTFASAEDLQSIKLDYLLQQQQAAVAMQSRQIEVLQKQIKHLKKLIPPPAIAHVAEPSQGEEEYDPNTSPEPAYSGDTTLLQPQPQQTIPAPLAQYQYPPRYKYVQVPSATLPIRYVRVQY